jgi:hypothetical protein
LAEGAGDLDGAAMSGDNGLANAQTQPQSTRRTLALPGLVILVEALKDVRQIVRRDAGASVCPFEHAPMLRLVEGQIEAHTTAGRRELEGVIEQIVNNLPKPVAVAVDQDGFQSAGSQLHAGALRHWLKHLQGIGDKLVQTQRLRVKANTFAQGFHTSRTV